MARKHISLGYMQSSDTREPRTMRLLVQSEDFVIETLADLSEHDFAALLSGQSIKVEAEI